jgi:steroid 5-alpha reductase family enzyme
MLCGAAYAAAAAVALAAGWAARDLHPLVVVLVADLAATGVVFGFSLAADNSSIYDPYWSVLPPLVALYWWLQPGAASGSTVRPLIVSGLVLAWAARLTFNWARRWEGLGSEDWRYRDFRTQWGRGYWVGSFFGIHLVPTLIVYLACLPFWPVSAAGSQPVGLLDLAAAVVTTGAILIETAADEQLQRFLTGPREPGQLLDTGLWAYSRHPNYFGEVAFWWGIWLFGLAAAPAFWWTVVGPLVMSALFVLISIPMIDRRSLVRRPAFADYSRRVSSLVPWLPKP